jgi:hypothetical protein
LVTAGESRTWKVGLTEPIGANVVTSTQPQRALLS